MRKRVLFIAAIFGMCGCNPNEPRGFKGPPVEAAKQPSGRSSPSSAEENRIGLTEQQKEARQNAGEVGPNAALPMKKQQFQFGASAGRTTGTPKPFADAEGEVLVKPNGPMSERQIYPHTPHPSSSPSPK